MQFLSRQIVFTCIVWFYHMLCLMFHTLVLLYYTFACVFTPQVYPVHMNYRVLCMYMYTCSFIHSALNSTESGGSSSNVFRRPESICVAFYFTTHTVSTCNCEVARHQRWSSGNISLLPCSVFAVKK